MKALDTLQELSPDSLNDVPPTPIRFNEYFERELHDRTRSAYEQGLDRGSKCRFGMLLLGMIIGWFIGFSVGVGIIS